MSRVGPGPSRIPAPAVGPEGGSCASADDTENLIDALIEAQDVNQAGFYRMSEDDRRAARRALVEHVADAVADARAENEWLRSVIAGIEHKGEAGGCPECASDHVGAMYCLVERALAQAPTTPPAPPPPKETQT